jgi:uncharacterized membrane protein
MVVPEGDVIDVDMSVEEAFTLIISTGVVIPRGRFPTNNKDNTTGK